MVTIGIASLNGQKVRLKFIAEECGSPEAFTSKVLQKLVHAGLLDSTKGAMGGFQVDKEVLDFLMVWEIIKVIDGEDLKYDCILGLKECSSTNPCPMHGKYEAYRGHLINSVFKKTSLKELITKVESGESNLII